MCFFLDVDECSGSINYCSYPNAYCVNTVGSFECTCASGYTGNGTVCEGK